MLVAGHWHLCDDGVTRPLLQANVVAAQGRAVAEDLLIDSGAHRAERDLPVAPTATSRQRPAGLTAAGIPSLLDLL
jgi:hypothetical protein